MVAVTQGAHGTVVIDALTGNPKYTPARSFIGSDAFTYTVVLRNLAVAIGIPSTGTGMPP